MEECEGDIEPAEISSGAQSVATSLADNDKLGEEHRRIYNESIKPLLSKQNCQLVTAEEKRKIVSTIANWDELSTAEKLGKYRWPRNFDFIKLGNAEPILFEKALADKFKDPINNSIIVDKIIRIATVEESFDILREIHLSIGHGRLKKMLAAIATKFSNISRFFVEAFLKGCSRCYESKPRLAARAGHTPIISKGFNSRAQVDLIDMQSSGNAVYKYIMVYEDHGLKFAHLFKLKSKHAERIAKKLLQIFTTQGAPALLHSDNGREFVNHILEELTKMWPELRIIHGRARHSESQGSVERLNRTVQDLLRNYLRERGWKGDRWPDALPFVQWQYNTRLHEAIKKSPYQCVFGRTPRIGLDLTALGLTVEQAVEVTTEEGLEVALETLGVVESNEVMHAQNMPIVAVEEHTMETEQPSKEDSGQGTSTATEESLLDPPTPGSPETPSRRKFQQEALEGLQNQAKRMKRMAALHSGPANLPIGAVVKIGASDVDRARLDPTGILAVVVEVTDDGRYRCATCDGILTPMFVRLDLEYLENTTPRNHNLDAVLESWPQLPSISVPQAVRKQSISQGGQGFQKCNCKSGCRGSACSCKKASLQCNSRCHNSLSCSNK